jgi:hypothetical protein
MDDQDTYLSDADRRALEDQAARERLYAAAEKLSSPEARAVLVDLLDDALAWRAQGHRSSWKTPESLALVDRVDAIRTAFPELCAELTPRKDSPHGRSAKK